MALPSNIIGVEYNAWMSLISFITTRLSTIASIYGLSGVTIDISPSYPKDLTRFSKPSIIIQKIHTNMDCIGFSSVLGQYYDSSSKTIYDVHGNVHTIEFQISVIGDNNVITQLITSALGEDILCRASHRRNSLTLKLYNYISSVKSPSEVGIMEIVDYIDAMHMASNENKDYYSAIRIEIGVIQHTFVSSTVVDLSKELKFTQTIIL